MSSSKKKKRPSAGDDLINSLFDETASKGSASSKAREASPVDDEANRGSLELAAMGEHDKLDPFEEFKRKRATKARKPNDTVKSNTGSIPVLDLEAIEREQAEPPRAPFADGEPLVTRMSTRPEPTYEAGEAEELADFTSDSSEQFQDGWHVGANVMSAPEEVAPTDESSEESSPAREPEDEERTMRLVISRKEAENATSDSMPTQSRAARSESFNRSEATEIRAGIRVPPAPKLETPVSAANAFTSPEAQLKQSESLRIAQNKITELERELERLRRDNEALSTAGDTLRRRGDELLTKTEALEIKAREATALLEEERRIMRGQLQAKDRDNAEMRARVEEIETRLESNFKKIRVRERELEHRLEIVKMESATLVSTKDKMILDLKRQIDQLTHEHDYAKTKTQELFNQYKDKQETQRRVVRALRIALTILEGDDETVVPLKKAE